MLGLVNAGIGSHFDVKMLGFTFKGVIIPNAMLALRRRNTV